MTSNDTTRTISPFGSRRIVYGCLIAAGLALYFGLQVVGYPIVGVGALVAGFGGAFALAATSNAPMWDERDDEIHRRAAGRTVALFGWLAAVAFPTVVVLDALGQLAFPPWLAPISAFVIVFYFTYGGFQLYDRFIADA